MSVFFSYHFFTECFVLIVIFFSFSLDLFFFYCYSCLKHFCISYSSFISTFICWEFEFEICCLSFFFTLFPDIFLTNFTYFFSFIFSVYVFALYTITHYTYTSLSNIIAFQFDFNFFLTCFIFFFSFWFVFLYYAFFIVFLIFVLFLLLVLHHPRMPTLIFFPSIPTYFPALYLSFLLSLTWIGWTAKNSAAILVLNFFWSWSI